MRRNPINTRSSRHIRVVNTPNCCTRNSYRCSVRIMKTILRDTHSLDAAGGDNISEQIADVLADYPYITKRDILRLRLGAEEILLHWRQEVGELRVELSIEEKGRWVDLMLQIDGVPYRLA